MYYFSISNNVNTSNVGEPTRSLNNPSHIIGDVIASCWYHLDRVHTPRTYLPRINYIAISSISNETFLCTNYNSMTLLRYTVHIPDV